MQPPKSRSHTMRSSVVQSRSNASRVGTPGTPTRSHVV